MCRYYCKVKVKVAQSCPTICSPTDYTAHGILQARILEWAAFPFPRGSSQPRDRTQVSRIAGRFFTSWATREAQNFSYKHKTEPSLVSFPTQSVGVSESPFVASLLTQHPFCPHSRKKRSEGDALAWAPGGGQALCLLCFQARGRQPSNGRLNQHVSCIALCKVRGKNNRLKIKAGASLAH